MSPNTIVNNKNVVTIDTRPGAPGNPIQGLAQLTSVIATQTNSLTINSQKLDSRVRTLTEVLTSVTAATIQNTKDISAVKKALLVKKKKTRGGRKKALRRLKGESRVATQAVILGIIDVGIAQEFRTLNNSLGEKVREDYLKEKEKRNQDTQKINQPAKSLLEGNLDNPILAIKEIRPLVNLERAKEKRTIESKIVSKEEEIKATIREAQRRTRAWVRQLPSLRSIRREHKRRLLLKAVEKAEELTPVTRANWLNWGKEKSIITQKDCEKYQRKLKQNLEIKILNCQREISRLEDSLEIPEKGL